MIPVVCLSCGTRQQALDKLSGQAVECSQCRERIEIPAQRVDQPETAYQKGIAVEQIKELMSMGVEPLDSMTQGDAADLIHQLMSTRAGRAHVKSSMSSTPKKNKTSLAHHFLFVVIAIVCGFLVVGLPMPLNLISAGAGLGLIALIKLACRE